jgi:hypothetical protein
MSRKANVVLAAAVGVIFVIAAVAAAIAVGRDPVILDPGSPEATVQAYLVAMADGDYGAAFDQLAEDSDCGFEDFAFEYRQGSLEAVLTHTEVDGAEAVVSVEVTDRYGEGPFDSSGYSHTETLLLRNEGGEWRLTGSPWPLYYCSGGVS